MSYADARREAEAYYELCERARRTGVETDLRGREDLTVAQLAAEVEAAEASR